MHRKACTLVAAAFALMGLFFLARAPSASAVGRANCENGIGTPSATAELDINAQRVDNPESVSTLQLDVTRAWPLAKNLFEGSGSAGYQEALNCLLPWEFQYSIVHSISVSLHGNYIRIVAVVKNFIYDWHLDPVFPWDVSSSHQAISLAFKPDSGVVNFTWKSIKVTVAGFRLEAPVPLPAAEPGKGQYIWRPVITRNKKTKAVIKANILPSFNLIPDERLSLVFDAEGSVSGQSTPFDAEQVVILLALAFFLTTCKDQGSVGGDRIRVCTRRLCLGAAAISVAQVLVDVASWRFHSGDLAPVMAIVTYLVLFALIGYWPTGTGARCVLAVILALNIATLLPLDGSGLWYEIVKSDALLLLALVCVIGVSFTAVLRNMAILLPAEREYASYGNWSKRQVLRGRIIGLAALGMALVSFLEIDNSFGGVFFAAALIRYLVSIGVLLVIAQRRRPVSVLLERKDQFLLALAVGYVMLVSGSQWYVGYAFSITCFIAIIAADVIMRFAGKHSILAPFARVLEKRAPSDLRLDQENLTQAERRVSRLTKDLKAFENVALTGKKLKRRKLLQKELARSRQWPAAAGAAGQEFPPSAGPADMALALGPACEAEGNLKRACLPAFVLAVVPACYFSVHEIQGAPFPVSPVSFAEDFVMNFWPNLLSWIFPLLVLSVAWSSLAGRRGMGRGIQIWLIFFIPLGIHALINRWLDQSATLTVVFQCALLLVLLTIVGLWLDLASISQYQNVSYFELFRGYVRLNRVIAVVTLLLPLVTAGLTIWNQIDSGVLQQKAPAQTPATPPPTHGP